MAREFFANMACCRFCRAKEGELHGEQCPEPFVIACRWAPPATVESRALAYARWRAMEMVIALGDLPLDAYDEIFELHLRHLPSGKAIPLRA